MELERQLKEDPKGVAERHRAAAKRTEELQDMDSEENRRASCDAAPTDDMHVGKADSPDEPAMPKPASVVINPRDLGPHVNEEGANASPERMQKKAEQERDRSQEESAKGAGDGESSARESSEESAREQEGSRSSSSSKSRSRKRR